MRPVLRSILTHQLHSAQPASGQVSPISAVTVNFILCGDVTNESRTFQGERTSQETESCWQRALTKAGLLFALAADIAAAAGSVLCTEHQASQVPKGSRSPHASCPQV